MEHERSASVFDFSETKHEKIIYQINIGDVKPTGCHISGNEDVDTTISEIHEGAFSLAL
jgi:hypothetical protein